MNWRRCFFAAVALLWVVVIALALEGWARVHYVRLPKKANAYYYGSRLPDIERRCAPVVEKYASRPLQKWPPRDAVSDAFFSLDEAGRSAFAQARGEVQVLSDCSGKVTAVYAATQPAEVAELGRRVRVGSPLADIFAREQVRQDVERAVQHAAQLPYLCAYEYPVQWADGSESSLEFSVASRRYHVGACIQELIRVHTSIWEVPGLRFRPHYGCTEPIPWAKCDEIRINNFGFIGDDIAVPKPPGTFRIVCIGGSTTAEGRTPELTYPGMLQRKLREHFKRSDVEVVNAGIFGLNTAQERSRLPDFLALQPDMLIHYNFVNELRSLVYDWEAPLPTQAVAWPDRLKKALRHSRFIERTANWWLLPKTSEIISEMQHGAIADLTAMAEETRTAGVEMAVCSFAYPQLGSEAYFYDVKAYEFFMVDFLTSRSYCNLVKLYNSLLKEACRMADISYVPVAEELVGGSEYFTDICHLNPAGIECKAGIVFKAIVGRVAQRLAERPEGRLVIGSFSR